MRCRAATRIESGGGSLSLSMSSSFSLVLLHWLNPDIRFSNTSRSRLVVFDFTEPQTPKRENGLHILEAGAGQGFAMLTRFAPEATNGIFGLEGRTTSIGLRGSRWL